MVSSHFYRQLSVLLLRTRKILVSNLSREKATLRVLVVISGLSVQIIESYLKVGFITSFHTPTVIIFSLISHTAGLTTVKVVALQDWSGP